MIGDMFSAMDSLSVTSPYQMMIEKPCAAMSSASVCNSLLTSSYRVEEYGSCKIATSMCSLDYDGPKSTGKPLIKYYNILSTYGCCSTGHILKLDLPMYLSIYASSVDHIRVKVLDVLIYCDGGYITLMSMSS